MKSEDVKAQYDDKHIKPTRLLEVNLIVIIEQVTPYVKSRVFYIDGSPFCATAYANDPDGSGSEFNVEYVENKLVQEDLLNCVWLEASQVSS